ncbi:MAG: hypothetical protein UR89_C0013G0004 [Candidatus Roizmanbacteria bacterium GW2011_GWA2_35_8]|uniref:Transposase IS200-like domain-containing protein n=1 Tax=Candidatus Roizmanbacteria bacterium GW2011_GWA2_35_8 TaxID=1618479 RepID=A0A0G0DDR2_9BACT|nr:MAG: hypothetical protein UR89_C0013G0004 [Candidatus Roizmanbacteria bacterium GW2011_GWA2_35_8]
MKRDIIENYIYHIFNKSIANYGIFTDKINSQKFLDTLYYYNQESIGKSFSQFLITNKDFHCSSLIKIEKNLKNKFLAYCIMPDHYHLLLKILVNTNFSKYLSDVENSYSRYFNLKFKRKGPLWQSAFKSVLIESEEQLLHVSRYIHLNPTSGNLVERPEDWDFSSYKEYIKDDEILGKYITEIPIQTKGTYRKFVEGNISYQRRLKIIKKAMID